MLNDILQYNEEFVERAGYKMFRTGKYPKKQLAILTCMDTRLTELLPAALGLENGDAKMIRNAGGMVTHPFDDAVRSLLIAVLELGVKHIMVITHTECGVKGVTAEGLLSSLCARGIGQETVERVQDQGIDLNQWLEGFTSPEGSVKQSVAMLKTHPFMPGDISVSGYVMEIDTGKLKRVA